MEVRLKYISYTGHLFLGLFKTWCRFQKWCKQFRKSFSFLDNCFWIRCCEFSLLRSEYLLSAVNVLTVLRFQVLLRETFSNSISPIVSSVKWSDPGHFPKAQGKFILSFPCTLFFYIFLTPKNYRWVPKKYTRSLYFTLVSFFTIFK